ncbi:hypothetical protein RYX36_002764 [Vicia faba]
MKTVAVSLMLLLLLVSSSDYEAMLDCKAVTAYLTPCLTYLTEAPSDLCIRNQGSVSSISSGEAVQNFKVFAATWNVGGQCPTGNLNLCDFLRKLRLSRMH